MYKVTFLTMVLAATEPTYLVHILSEHRLVNIPTVSRAIPIPTKLAFEYHEGTPAEKARFDKALRERKIISLVLVHLMCLFWIPTVAEMQNTAGKIMERPEKDTPEAKILETVFGPNALDNLPRLRQDLSSLKQIPVRVYDSSGPKTDDVRPDFMLQDSIGWIERPNPNTRPIVHMSSKWHEIDPGNQALTLGRAAIQAALPTGEDIWEEPPGSRFEPGKMNRFIDYLRHGPQISADDINLGLGNIEYDRVTGYDAIVDMGIEGLPEEWKKTVKYSQNPWDGTDPWLSMHALSKWCMSPLMQFPKGIINEIERQGNGINGFSQRKPRHILDKMSSALTFRGAA
ncbi:hypothetical protein CPB86DRAFT_802074 [Serendipita vermifera]|nr:hypothetical protein CPB86DRAFT_802074 [Serendipita vermifera]